MVKSNSKGDTEKMQAAVLRPLAYFDIFRYPLKVEEIHCYLPVEMSKADLINQLELLTERGIIFCQDGFYSLDSDFTLIDRRRRGNELAEKMMPAARRWAAFVAHFPFVQAVFFSGSLSKNFLTDGGDVDYFIITSPQRLWICRTMLVMFKKIFLLNSKKYFCLNYFVAADQPQIEEKNIFTATECTTLIPVCANGVATLFYDQNSWVKEYYPNNPIPAPLSGTRSNPLRTISEWLLSGVLGDHLDERFMRFTMRHWQKKFGHLTDVDLEVAFKSRRYVSKHHPGNFQQRVIQAYIEKCQMLSRIYGIILPPV